MTEIIPGVYKCLNPYCVKHSEEYVVWSSAEKTCPNCKVQGEWRRSLKNRKSRKFTCGLCLTIMWLDIDEWPVGQYNWGIIQLGPNTKTRYVCCACLEDLKRRYPSLNKEPSEEGEVLPKIVHLAKADV